MNLIQELETYRKREGLSQADMARMLDVTEQRYNNWIYRDSLPKAFYEKAKELVGETSVHFSQMREIMAMLNEAEQEKLVAQAAMFALKLRNGQQQ